jgi:uncharacterized tellurite resistance protein B-like protein
MEGFLGILGSIFGFIVINVVYRLVMTSIHAAGKTVVNGGSFKENLDLSLNGMGPLQMRVLETRLENKEGSPIIKEIEVKGLFPITSKTRVGFVTSVVDTTDETSAPVISLLDDFQEKKSFVYQHHTPAGEALPNHGFIKWVRVGIVIPGILQPPRSGLRKLTILVRMIDLDNPPEIHQGFHTGKPPGLLWLNVHKFELEVKEKGWAEAAEHRDEAQALSVKIAVFVAMIDGVLGDKEGETVKKWITKSLSSLSEPRISFMKQLFNDAFKEAYLQAQSGALNLTDITARLHQIGELKTKYDAIELCMDVMAADGKVDADELRIIRKIAESLELNIYEIEKIKDQRIIMLDATTTGDVAIEELLGIQKDWDDARVRKHLREEFQKWNNRLNALPDGDERANAQKMLDMIAEARKKAA